MADRPILFSGPMVRALLDGRKTQTRRIVNGVPPQPAANCHPSNTPRHPAPYLDSYCGQPKTAANPRGMSTEWLWWQVDDRCGYPSFKVKFAPGDRLWVREAHYLTDDGDYERAVCAADAEDVREHLATVERLKASHPQVDWSRHARLRPGIHMPRWASRLTLIVTDVRMQRLLEISDEDAVAEGIQFTDFGMYQPPGEMSVDGGKTFHRFKLRQHDGWHWQEAAKSDECLSSASSAYCNLWNHINGDGAATANPWVAAYTFTVERRNIGEAVD